MLSPVARHRLDRVLLVLTAVAIFGAIATAAESHGSTNGPQLVFRLASIVFIVLTSVRAIMSKKSPTRGGSNNELKDVPR